MRPCQAEAFPARRTQDRTASWDGEGNICMAVICRVASTEPSPVVMDIDVANPHHLTGEPSRSLNEEGGVPLALYYKSRGSPGKSSSPSCLLEQLLGERLSITCFQNAICRAGETGPPIKFLLCKPENRSLIPRVHVTRKHGGIRL